LDSTAAEERPRNNRRSELLPHNCHFSPNTIEVLKLHDTFTDSGGVSALVRTVIEFYLADAVNFADPRFRDVTPIIRPRERYRGHHKKLGLV